MTDPPPPTTLTGLEGRNRACRACHLRPGCTQVVVAEGRADAPLLIVGEGPGAHEDREGRPFVGPGGQLLDRILHAAGIGRDETYLTNVVKCRPRPPRPAAARGPHLRRPLAGTATDAAAPRVILAVGHTAATYLLDTRLNMGALRGQWFRYRHDDGQGGTYTAHLMPLLHPAYLLRRDTRAPGGPKSLTWRDIREAAAVLRGLHEPQAFADPAPPDMQGQPGLF
ncbi:uracil-DNA glycosylase [Deinococcus caeni]|uniref:uracil-DNA glycosylase n=1 Tax=Deinococcus caeni TaxID=569127 RepID=UPI0036195580